MAPEHLEPGAQQSSVFIIEEDFSARCCCTFSLWGFLGSFVRFHEEVRSKRWHPRRNAKLISVRLLVADSFMDKSRGDGSAEEQGDKQSTKIQIYLWIAKKVNRPPELSAFCLSKSDSVDWGRQQSFVFSTLNCKQHINMLPYFFRFQLWIIHVKVL